MKIRSLIAIAASALLFAVPAPASSKKPKISVRFHTEANQRDSGSFAMPVKLQYAQREAVLSRVPEFSERNIEAIFPFPASDGSWGCAFKLDPQGRIRLDTMSNQQRGRALVVFVGTKQGKHQVVDMIIDGSVPNGMITVPRGLTELEVAYLRKDFKVMGEEPEKKPKKNWFGGSKEESVPGAIDRERDSIENKPSNSTARPPAPKPDLPRLAD